MADMITVIYSEVREHKKFRNNFLLISMYVFR